jgi:ATP-dependent DNA ligase
MKLPFSFPLAPMLCSSRDEMPKGSDWFYEPKWDGFRAIIFRVNRQIIIQSRHQKRLEKYFPELQTELLTILPKQVVLDGEIVLANSRKLEFDELMLRINSSLPRIRAMSEESPASFVAFDLLAFGQKDFRNLAFAKRRKQLEKLATNEWLQITPGTTDAAIAAKWLRKSRQFGFEGIVAKNLKLPYRSASRSMIKVRKRKTIDCLIAGYSPHRNALLLALPSNGEFRIIGFALYNSAHTGEFTKIFRRAKARTKDIWIPDGLRSWVKAEDTHWQLLRPQFVCEVAFDHYDGSRFRHPARFLRLRFDKTF